MYVYGLVALVCASGVIAYFVPNVMALAGITVVGLLAITLASLKHMHSLQDTLISIAIFLVLSQASFLLGSFLFGDRHDKRDEAKPKHPPYA
jgi:hypothetical protein